MMAFFFLVRAVMGLMQELVTAFLHTSFLMSADRRHGMPVELNDSMA